MNKRGTKSRNKIIKFLKMQRNSPDVIREYDVIE